MSAPPAGSVGATAQPWAFPDPDLTTPENEAELDYMSRVALALLLFRDRERQGWDFRSELFVRYGPPAAIEVNPAGSTLEYEFKRRARVRWAPDPLKYPYTAQVWHYPELGMDVEMWDRSLTQSFQLPPAEDRSTDPRPDPARLAARPDLVPLAGGRGVFRVMPPGMQPMAARAQLSQFPTDQGARLVAYVVAPGEPGSPLVGSWAIAGADGRVVARDAHELSASACDPAAQRFADFTAELPPGDYRVDLSVNDPRGRRALVKLAATVPPAAAGLALSDLVLLCGLDASARAGEAVRIEPDFDRRVAGTLPLTVYFEIDHLAADRDGRARFAYRYAVLLVGKNGRRGQGVEPAFEASREESHDGPRRRQFVTVPTRSLKSGTYDLEVEVRDLVANTTAAATARFVRP